VVKEELRGRCRAANARGPPAQENADNVPMQHHHWTADYLEVWLDSIDQQSVE